MKLLLIHNTLPSYRVNFFNELGKLCDLTLVFHEYNLNNVIYSDIDRADEIKNANVYKDYSSKLIDSLLKKEKYDAVIMPPLDTPLAVKISNDIIRRKKVYGYKVGLFWEKWQAPTNRTPFKKRVKNSIQNIGIRPILNGIDVFISSGTKSKEYFLNRKIPEEKIFIALDATTIGESNSKINICNEYGIDKNSKVVLYYGRIIKRKGLGLLIDALKDNVGAEITLLICGSGEDEYFFKKEAETKLQIPYIFAGRINPEHRKEYLAQSDIFVLPSYFEKGVPEAWGLTVNEALMANTTVVTTTAVGSAFDLIKNDNGIIVEENNIKELKSAINYLLNNEHAIKHSSHIPTTKEMAFSFIESLKGRSKE